MVNNAQIPCFVCRQTITVGSDAIKATCGRHFAAPYADPPTRGATIPRHNHGLGQFVADQCADFINRACLTHKGGPCIVLDGKRCGRFEKCLLPLAREIGGKTLEAVQEHYAVGQMLASAAVGPVNIRSCPDCGTPLGAGRRLCPDCAKKRQRAAKRTAWQKAHQPLDS